ASRVDPAARRLAAAGDRHRAGASGRRVVADRAPDRPGGGDGAVDPGVDSHRLRRLHRLAGSRRRGRRRLQRSARAPAFEPPPAVSGELTYYYWSPATLDGPVISVGLDPAFLATLFDGCAQVATVSNSYGLQNQEAGVPIVVCSTPRLPP